MTNLMFGICSYIKEDLCYQLVMRLIRSMIKVLLRLSKCEGRKVF